MNNLNSVLLEGNLVDNPLEVYGNTEFKIKVCRACKDEDTIRHLVSVIDINVRPGRLAETCAEYLRRDRGVRIIGRLVGNDSKAFVEAEHVEFKPVKREDGV